MARSKEKYTDTTCRQAKRKNMCAKRKNTDLFNIKFKIAAVDGGLKRFTGHSFGPKGKGKFTCKISFTKINVFFFAQIY